MSEREKELAKLKLVMFWTKKKSYLTKKLSRHDGHFLKKSSLRFCDMFSAELASSARVLKRQMGTLCIFQKLKDV